MKSVTYKANIDISFYIMLKFSSIENQIFMRLITSI